MTRPGPVSRAWLVWGAALAAYVVAVLQRTSLGVAGIDATRGVSCVQFHEVAVKQAAMARSVENYLVVDSSKFGQVKPAFFARCEDFDRILTDDALAPPYSTDETLQPRLRLASR